MYQDIQYEDEDVKYEIFNKYYQGKIGTRDAPIMQLHGYMIQSFKDVCEKYHGDSNRTELDEVKTYLETKMWIMKQKVFNSKKIFIQDGKNMSDGVYISSNVLCSKKHNNYGTKHYI